MRSYSFQRWKEVTTVPPKVSRRLRRQSFTDGYDGQIDEEYIATGKGYTKGPISVFSA